MEGYPSLYDTRKTVKLDVSNVSISETKYINEILKLQS